MSDSDSRPTRSTSRVPTRRDCSRPSGVSPCSTVPTAGSDEMTPAEVTVAQRRQRFRHARTECRAEQLGEELGRDERELGVLFADIVPERHEWRRVALHHRPPCRRPLRALIVLGQ
eukprot:scaffold4967_cov116-Isochrysis_galbana.AAC.3